MMFMVSQDKRVIAAFETLSPKRQREARALIGDICKLHNKAIDLQFRVNANGAAQIRAYEALSKLLHLGGEGWPNWFDGSGDDDEYQMTRKPSPVPAFPEPWHCGAFDGAVKVPVPRKPRKKS